MPNLALLVATVVAACLWPTDEPPQGATPGVLVSPQAPIDTTVGMSADTYLRQSEPNRNFGTEPFLRVRPTGKNRALLAVDQTALAALIGGATVTAARLELTITENANNWGPEGRAIALHRLTVPWSETAATWNCGVDTVPGNPQAECAARTAWEMGGAGPWVVPPTATATITNGLRGVVTFDVAADVAAWLSGTPNAGWILKRVDEGPSGAVEFGSRESGSPPVLVLTLAVGDTSRPPIPDGFVAPDGAVALLVSPPGDDSVLVLRDFIRIIFDDTTSGYTIRSVFARYGGHIVGGDTLLESYMVQVPDPGPTYAALDSLLSRVRSEPGVRFAIRYVFSEPVRDPGRYPEDDPQSSRRQDWCGPGTDGTRALTAIRAPLAWSCETGLYGTDAVAIGVMEDVVDATIPDLAPSFSRLHAASASQPINTTVTLSVGALSHGTGVAGVLSARGDNGLGVPGLTWQSELHVFRLAREDGNTTRMIRDRAQAIERAIRLAAATPVRILHSSVEATADPEEARVLAAAIADFVNTSPGRIFVQAGGDNRYTIRPDTILQIGQGGFVMHQAMVLLDPTVKARVLLVGAANRDGTDIWGLGLDPNAWGSATLISGVTDILVPAADILTLVRPQDFNGASVRSGSGTSFGAPMVSGTAALLWAFDPTLTADEVKGYIVDGARERMSATGTIEPSPVVPNSGGLNLLDAYEALARASRERPGTTPICGGQVWASEASIHVDQGAPALRIIPVPSARFLGLASVAQGGRRIAVTDFRFPDPTETLIVTNTGAIDSVLGGVYARQYLERGTADLKVAAPDGSFAEGLVLTLRGTGVDLTDQHLDGVTAPPGASESRAEYIIVSPLGDLAAVQTPAWMPDGGGTARWDLVRLTSPPQAAGNIMDLQFPADPVPCATDCRLGIWNAAWTHDSRRVVFTLAHADYYQGGGGGGDLGPPAGIATGAQLENGDLIAIATRLISVPIVNGAAQAADSTPLLEGEWLASPRFTADDVLLIAEHLGLVDGVVGGTCEEKRRLPASPFTVQAARAPLLAAFCDPYADGPRIFNAPPAAVASRTRYVQRR